MVISLLISLVALAKPITIDDQVLKNMLLSRDCNGGCLSAGDEFGRHSPRKKKCGCGRWEEPKELLEGKLWLNSEKPSYNGKVYSSDIGRAPEPWEQNTQSEPAKMGVFLKSLQEKMDQTSSFTATEN